MCVLVVADKRRPTEDEMEKMSLTNADGAGIAWRENGVVKWEKGLDLAEISEIVKDAPMPFVLHFRIASCGGKTKEMTHPFPVEKDVSLALAGQTKGFVLFHNGHWGQWRDKGIDGAIKNRVKVPDGKWSDTRVMAWLAHMHGSPILELIDEKVIMFGPNKIEIYHPDGWFRVNELLVSNRIWEHQYVHHSYGGQSSVQDGWPENGANYELECRMANCSKEKLSGSAYCVDHQPACRQMSCNKPRLVGSEYCLDHRDICSYVACNNTRISGTNFCVMHMPLVPIKQPGGVVNPPLPFRQGLGPVQSGAYQQDGVPPPTHRVGNDPATDKVTPLETVATGFQKESRWARPVNIRRLDPATDQLPIM